jgi:DNA mismatch repair ATPase MutS
MAEKSLAMIGIAYNLLRLLMQRAAHHAAKTVTMISFKGILDLVTTTHQDFRQEIGRPKRHRQRLKILIEIASRRTLDIRPNRREPRAVKRRPKPFALLTSPRGEFTEISHRSRYRKSA